jgi:hypothetical protein
VSCSFSFRSLCSSKSFFNLNTFLRTKRKSQAKESARLGTNKPRIVDGRDHEATRGLGEIRICPLFERNAGTQSNGKESGEEIALATLAPGEIPILFIEMSPLRDLKGEC